MFKPYKAEKNETSAIIEFRSAYLWILYLILTTIGLGYFLDNVAFIGIGGLFMLLYFVFISMQYTGVNTQIKKAMREGAIELS